STDGVRWPAPNSSYAGVLHVATQCATVCHMKPVTVTTTIGRPRDEIHAVLDDLMNHEAFTDHFLTDFQRTETGIRVKGKGGGGWMEIRPVESTPERIVEE